MTVVEIIRVQMQTKDILWMFTSGMVITLILPGAVADKEDEDILNDNRYLITKIHHVIAPLENRGTMVCQVVKESLADKIENVDPLKHYGGARQD